MTDIDKFKFHCKACGKCCKGELGYLYLTFLDVIRISQYLDIAVKEFLKKYCFYDSDTEQLFLNFPCQFQEDKLCGIYPVRPIQCISYPFWEDLLRYDPLDNKDNKEIEDYCEPIKNFQPFKLLSEDSILRLKGIDENLYNTDHLEILIAMGFISEEDITEIGFKWIPKKKFYN